MILVAVSQNCVDGVFDDIRNGVNVTKNTALAEEMSTAIKLLLNFTESKLGQSSLTATILRRGFSRK